MNSLKLTDSVILDSISRLLDRVLGERYLGYDPYDGIHSIKLDRVRNKWFRYLMIQLQVSSPINFRPMLGIEKGIDIKGLGLFLRAFVKLRKLNVLDPAVLDREIDWITDYLLSHSLREKYGVHCWSGHYFKVQGRKGFLAPDQPEIISSTVIGEALLELYDETHDPSYLEVVTEIIEFLQRDLYRDEGEIRYFAYHPDARNRVVYNATALGVGLIANRASFSPDLTELPLEGMMEHIIRVQKSNGMWNYSYEVESRNSGTQVDFHQGYILDPLHDFIRYRKDHGSDTGVYMDALKRGADFYWNEQFLPDGRAKWRWPRIWPIDIHNLAQGIITFSKLGSISEGYLENAGIIADWTIRNMQDQTGYFYYQRWPWFSNRIEFMRWGQAWMMLALATLLEKRKEAYDE